MHLMQLFKIAGRLRFKLLRDLTTILLRTVLVTLMLMTSYRTCSILAFELLSCGLASFNRSSTLASEVVLRGQDVLATSSP